MRLAFVLYKYFPFGGLQRDMVRIAAACRRRGHSICVYTLSWKGDVPEGIVLHELDVRCASRHARNRAFHGLLQRALQQDPVDLVVGFNKMPGLDVYYAADGCLREKLFAERGFLARLLPRYRHFLADEKAVFGPASKTEILMISPLQQRVYQRHYGTSDARLHMLPPGIARDRMAGGDADSLRISFRKELAISDDELLIVCIGSGFRTKGLDRSLAAFAALPVVLRARSHLVAIGDDNPAPFLRLAKKLQVADRFRVLRGRGDIPSLLQGADLLLHPAYYENTGTVLLEAVVAGLPVLTTDNCGYAFHVEQADAGQVVASPFEQSALDRTLASMLESSRRESWSANGIRYGQTAQLYDMPDLAATFIDEFGRAA